jgi:excisionase family DNA binding protein
MAVMLLIGGRVWNDPDIPFQMRKAPNEIKRVPCSHTRVRLETVKDKSPSKTRKFRRNGSNEILTTRMVAEYLHCHLSTVYRLVKQGKIPHFKLGGDLRFEKAAIDEWIERGGGAQD